MDVVDLVWTGWHRRTAFGKIIQQLECTFFV